MRNRRHNRGDEFEFSQRVGLVECVCVFCTLADQKGNNLKNARETGLGVLVERKLDERRIVAGERMYVGADIEGQLKQVGARRFDCRAESPRIGPS